MRNGYTIDTLTSVDICDTVKVGGKLNKIYEGFIYRENFNLSAFRKINNEIFTLRQKKKDTGNDLMQGSFKLFMNNL